MKPIKPLNAPSPSLRLAFWGFITTSGIFWLLALLLGGVLTSCSGSIFSSDTKDTKSYESSPRHYRGEDIEVVDEDPNKPLPAPKGLVKDVASPLATLELLFPAETARLTKNLKRKEKEDALSQLKLDISVLPTAHKSTFDAVMTLSNDDDAVIAEKSLKLDVTTNEVNAKRRSFFANSTLTFKGERIMIAFSLIFEKGQMTAGKIIRYQELLPVKEYPLSKTQSRVSYGK